MLLSVDGLTKEFKRGTGFFRAVDDVSFSMEHQEFISIVGRSGSGKSTLLNMIAGLLQPGKGSICLNGNEILRLNDEEGSFLRNAKIGYVTQGQSVLSNLSVIDNVRLPFFLFKREGNPSEKALSLLEQMGAAHLAHSYPSQLSGGELKRVAIARALINSPEILIADEPTSDLDSQTTRDVMQLFASLAEKGTAILIVTHEQVVSDYCKRTMIMEDGKLKGQ